MQFESLGLCETLLYAPKSVQTFIEQVMTTAEYVLRSIAERLNLHVLPNQISWIFFFQIFNEYFSMERIELKSVTDLFDEYSSANS